MLDHTDKEETLTFEHVKHTQQDKTDTIFFLSAKTTASMLYHCLNPESF